MRRAALGDACLRVASDLGDELCGEAYWDGQRCNWVGRSPLEATDLSAPLTPTVTALGPDLYSGTAGVGLFLAQLCSISRKGQHRTTALGALRQAASRADRIPPSSRLGLYTGVPGIAYALGRAGVLLDEPDLVHEGGDLALRACGQIGDSETLDLLGGAAGAACGLLALPVSPGSEAELLDAAVAIGECLVAAARKDDGKWSWDSEKASGFQLGTHALNGLAHGAGGIGLALLELHSRVGRPVFLEGALGAFAYEDSWFSQEEHNWADLRSDGGPDSVGQAPGAEAEPGYMTAWCHGAPGIGLIRLRALALQPEYSEALRANVDAAVEATTRRLRQMQGTPASDVTPCHGAAGLIELLSCVGRSLDREDAREAARRAWTAVLKEHQESSGWVTGIASGGKNQSLMLGTSGIGYSLLRFRDPASVPSILLVTA
jgi:lantibiotic modifying enzyme